MQSNRILLSLVIPLLNASEDIEGLFQAIGKQKNVDKEQLEVIAVNDGSTDDTAQQIEQHKAAFKEFADFKVITHSSRMGLAQTRFDGAKAARGKFLTFVDKRTRPDPDYLENFLNKKRNIIIGNIYMDKSLSPWDRLLVLVRKKLYFPYFNHPFNDIELDRESYRDFKNKGGGGAMLVLRDYYLKVSATFKRGKDVNDDSLLIENLLGIEPLLKTASARALYLNRTGFKENVMHIYNRGPKFVDYYTKPGTRFFPVIVALVVFILVNIGVAVMAPQWLLAELLAALVILVAVSAYLAESVMDFFTCVVLLPVALVSFSAGILKGLGMKLLRKY